MTIKKIVENRGVTQILSYDDSDAKHLGATIIEPDKQSTVGALQVTVSQSKGEEGKVPSVFLTLCSRNSSDTGFRRLSAQITGNLSALADNTVDEPNITFPSKDRATAFIKDSGAAIYANDGVKSIDLYPDSSNPPKDIISQGAVLKDLVDAKLISQEVQQRATQFLTCVQEQDLLTKGTHELSALCSDLVESQHAAGKGARGGRG